MLKCQIWLLGGADNQCQFGVTILYLILLFPGYSEPSAKKAFMMDLSRKYTQTFSNVVPTVCFEPSVYIYIFIICPDSLEFAITVRWRNWIGRTKLIHLYIYTRNVCISSWTSNLFDTNIAKLYITVYLPYYHFSIQRHGRVYFCWRQTNLSRIPITPCIYIDRLLHWYIDR